MSPDLTNTPVAVVNWPSAPFTESLVRKALGPLQVKIETSVPDPSTDLRLIQWSAYDTIDHELTHSYREAVLSSSYTFRKALIRKHFLSRSIHSYLTKYPVSVLKAASPKTYEIEISFADELDEMWTDDLWELGEELETSRWWILKPGMADRGMGIRLFNSKAMLAKIFEEFECEDSDGEEGENGAIEGTAVVTSQLRHFVLQEYVSTPLLLDPSDVQIEGSRKPLQQEGHKFHLRAYCVASGALKLYLYNRVLALFSAVPYQDPVSEDESPIDLTAHLTNTSLQTHRGEEGVRLLEELIGCRILSYRDDSKLEVLTADDVQNILGQLADVLAETFKAALQNPVHFQPLSNAFELFGVDFLVSHNLSSSPELPSFQVKILEINAEPAIELTGPRLSWILEDLFVAIGKICVEPFIAKQPLDRGTGNSWAVGEVRHNLTMCLNEEVRGPGN